MKHTILPSALLAAIVLTGCGSAPSTPIAPDQTLPDTSKMSAEDAKKLHDAGVAAGSDRAGTSAPGGAPAGHGSTPSDRGG